MVRSRLCLESFITANSKESFVVAVADAVEMKVADVVFREDLYPRIETSAVTVQKYAEDLDVLPPIEVNQRKELIDGWHRWTAHKKNGVETIRAIITETKSDAELLERAIATNASHGLQLGIDDKASMAIRIWEATPKADRPAKEKELCRILSVSDRQLQRFLSRRKKDAKDAAKKTAFQLWLACHTQEEIAERIDEAQPTVKRWIDEFIQFGQMSEMNKADAEHAVDFKPPLYNVWKQQEKTPGSSHFGNSEVRWVDNLLYLYTQPFDVVMDPFAGGGSTIDICKKRFRRYYVSDRKPIVEREKEIRKHDLTDGLPKPPQWKDVRLLYLDPPYWIQAEGQYSDDPTDLGNMSLEQFTTTLAKLIKDFSKKLSSGAVIALIIQPTQWKAEGKAYTDHIADMIRAVDLPIDMRFSVPYESQQCTAQMVEWAKAERRCLVLTREIVCWRVK